MAEQDNKFLRYWLPLYSWMGIIFFVSSIPQALMPKFVVEFKVDKVVHFFEYSVLGALILRAFLHSEFDLGLGHVVFIAIISAFIFAAIDEGYQYFIPGRTADLADWICDCLGSSSGIVLYLIGTLSSE